MKVASSMGNYKNYSLMLDSEDECSTILGNTGTHTNTTSHPITRFTSYNVIHYSEAVQFPPEGVSTLK
jgi:hypothetical protein